MHKAQISQSTDKDQKHKTQSTKCLCFSAFGFCALFVFWFLGFVFFVPVFAQDVPRDITDEEVKNGGDIISTTVIAGIIPSKSEAKRLIDQGAVRVNGEVVETWEYTLEDGDVIQIGPKKFLKVTSE